jgi:hypothetical protein
MLGTCRFARGGIVETAFWIQVVNAFLPDILTLFEPFRLFNYHFLSRFARSQAFLDACVAPIEFSLPLRFAAAIKTITLSILYAPVLPISPAIGLVGIFFSYATDMCAPPLALLHAKSCQMQLARQCPYYTIIS